MPASILVVEDDAGIREMIAMGLEQTGFQVRQAESAEDARASMRLTRPDLVLLDWMLPGQSGLDFARALKRDRDTQQMPLIMLTARGEEADKVRGLDTGADDYITKPFSPKEMVSRIRAVLRRAAPTATEAPVEVEGLRLDPVSHRVSAGGDGIDLGPTEFRLLHFLMTHQDRVFTRAQLLDNVWGTNVYVEERTVDVHVRRLRKGLTASGHDALVQTVRGAGYRFSTRR